VSIKVFWHVTHELLDLEDEGTTIFRTSETTHPIQRHILNLQQHSCVNLNSQTVSGNWNFTFLYLQQKCCAKLSSPKVCCTWNFTSAIMASLLAGVHSACEQPTSTSATGITLHVSPICFYSHWHTLAQGWH